MAILLLVLFTALSCSEQRAGDAPADAGTAARQDDSLVPAGEWVGEYVMRGTIGRNRQASGVLVVKRLGEEEPLFARTRERVRLSYPAYDGPFYSARLTVAQETDTVSGTFTCAHGPAMAPPLVCDPAAPIPELEDATLVLRPDGRAVLTGSHGEGVTLEIGRFTWTPAAAG